MKPGSRPSYKGEETGTQQSNLLRITKPACSWPGGKQFACFKPSSLCSDHQQTLVTSLPSTGHGALPGRVRSMPTHGPPKAPTLGPGMLFPPQKSTLALNFFQISESQSLHLPCSSFPFLRQHSPPPSLLYDLLLHCVAYLYGSLLHTLVKM